jgi:DNA polymerase-3 subunit epsilon
VEAESEGVPLDEITFTVLDVETTGLTPQLGDRVCEIAVLRFRGDRELARFQSLVNPQRPISPGAFAVNGIRDQDVVDAPFFAEIAPTVVDMLDDSTLVAHNAPFDLSFLASELRICGLPFVLDSIIDTLALARRYYRFPSNSLQAVAHYLGVETTGRHRALADVVTTKMVLERFVVDLGQKGVTTLAGLLAAQGGDIGWYEREEIPLPPQIEEALKSGGSLWLRYLSAAGEETRRVVSPLQVTTYSGYAYLVAFCHLRAEQRTFRLDRIVEMRPRAAGDMEPSGDVLETGDL